MLDLGAAAADRRAGRAKRRLVAGFRERPKKAMRVGAKAEAWHGKMRILQGDPKRNIEIHHAEGKAAVLARKWCRDLFDRAPAPPILSAWLNMKV